ncbi:MAG TPA: hypothetical protein VNJ07_02155 [Chitinophagales bacterium]|nr:hypothetical protein [Chitinophagales bacterium]
MATENLAKVVTLWCKIRFMSMVNNYFKSAGIVSFILFFLVSCNNRSSEKEKLIARKWSYKEFRMNNDTMTAEQMGNPTMEFFPDGKYKVEMGKIVEEGKWHIEGDELVTTVLKKNSKPDTSNKLKIYELTADKLVLHSDAGGNKAYVTLIPYSEK